MPEESRPARVRITAYVDRADKLRLLKWTEDHDRTPSAALAIILPLGLDHAGAEEVAS